MIGEIKIELELPATILHFVVTDLDYTAGSPARIRQDPNDSHPAEDAKLEITEYHIENHRERKIHFSPAQAEQIFEAFKEEIEDAVWEDIQE